MRRVGRAIGDHGLIEPGDRILVGISGGKDSFALLHMLDLHRRRFRFDFKLFPVFLDTGWDPAGADLMAERMERHGCPVERIGREIKRCVTERLRPGTNPCALCSRLRRGFLYHLAVQRGYDKIALGHHLDDLLETLLLNLFFTGQLKSMAVNLTSDDGRNRVIRPLAYVEAELLQAFCAERGFEPVELACPYHSGKTEPRREMVRKLIARVGEQHPRVRRSMLAALKHVRPSHLLDPDLQPESSRW